MSKINRVAVSGTKFFPSQDVEVHENYVGYEDAHGNYETSWFAQDMGTSRQAFLDATPKQRGRMLGGYLLDIEEASEVEELMEDGHVPVYQVMVSLPSGAYIVGITTTPKLFVARYVSERMKRGTECIFHNHCKATYTRRDGVVIQITWSLWSQDRDIWVKMDYL